MEIQLDAFGLNLNQYIEGSTCEYHNKYHNYVSNQGKVHIDFCSHLLDASDQNEATTFEHVKKFIHWMYDTNLFIKDVIIYATTDGCIKQYQCENSMGVLSVLSFA